MVRGTILAAAIIAAGATSASAEITFVGTIKTIAVTPQCQFVQRGWLESSRFHPRMVGNGQFTGITFIGEFGAQSYRLENVPFDVNFRDASAHAIFTFDYSWTGSQIRLVSQTPATITSSTVQVYMTGVVTKFGNDPGGTACRVTFTASYLKDN